MRASNIYVNISHAWFYMLTNLLYPGDREESPDQLLALPHPLRGQRGGRDREKRRLGFRGDGLADESFPL